MYSWFIVYMDGSVETICADDLDDIYRHTTKDVRSVTRLSE